MGLGKAITTLFKSAGTYRKIAGQGRYAARQGAIGHITHALKYPSEFSMDSVTLPFAAVGNFFRGIYNGFRGTGKFVKRYEGILNEKGVEAAEAAKNAEKFLEKSKPWGGGILTGAAPMGTGFAIGLGLKAGSKVGEAGGKLLWNAGKLGFKYAKNSGVGAAIGRATRAAGSAAWSGTKNMYINPRINAAKFIGKQIPKIPGKAWGASKAMRDKPLVAGAAFYGGLIAFGGYSVAKASYNNSLPMSPQGMVNAYETPGLENGQMQPSPYIYGTRTGTDNSGKEALEFQTLDTTGDLVFALHNMR